MSHAYRDASVTLSEQMTLSVSFGGHTLLSATFAGYVWLIVAALLVVLLAYRRLYA